MYDHRTAFVRTLILALVVCGSACLTSRAHAEAQLLIEVESGKVLHAENAGMPWYPASITKIMTTYVTLRAIKEGRITLDTLLTVSPTAAAQAPVKMGFPAGTTVTVDNALKMLLVKSANDIAVVIAEGVGGSVEGFADLMNYHAQRLGMVQSHFVNPNGLPADEQVTSARDMAIVARAALREFPEYDYFWHLPGIRWGKRVQRTYNTLLGRYPGTDGMKTGFICASGFNLVATATRDGKRLLAVVFGAPSASGRAIKAAQMLERGFSPNTLAWLSPSMGTVDQIQPVAVDPPNLRDDMCGKHRKRQATEDEDDSAAISSTSTDSAYAVFLSSLRAPTGKQQNLLQDLRIGEPVPVFTGAPKKQLSPPTATAGRNGTPTVNAASWSAFSPASVATAPASLVNPSADPDDVPKPPKRPKSAARTAPAVTAKQPAKPPAAKSPAAKTAKALPKTTQKK